MKEVPLAKGKGVAIIDDCDYNRVSQYKWYKSDRGYVKAGMKINGVFKVVSIHRFILGLTDPKIEVDHINRSRLDNRRKNLRTCSHVDNSRNITPSGRSKYLGVCYLKSRGREYIVAQINPSPGIHKHIGTFKTEKDAARAYDYAAKKYFGEFANLNFKECSV